MFGSPLGCPLPTKLPPFMVVHRLSHTISETKVQVHMHVLHKPDIVHEPERYVVPPGWTNSHGDISIPLGL